MNVEPESRKKVSIYILDGLLWLVSAGLGLLSIEALYRLSGAVYALLNGRPGTARDNSFYSGVLAGQVTVFVGAVLWLVVIVATGEYHIKHPGERKSWMIFAWTIGVELVLIAVGFLLA